MSFAKYTLLLPIAILAGCGGHSPSEPAAKPLPAVKVSTAAAEVQTLTGEREIPGTVTARTTLAVSTRTQGHILEIRVREGDRVQAGQVIATIDSREAATAITQAEAMREEARAALPEAEAAIASANAQAELARATFRRMEELNKSKSITGQEFDEAQARLRLAESQVAMAKAKVQQINERVRQAESGVARAKLQQGYGEVAAPVAGIVLERRAEPGMFAGPGMPIVIVEKAGDYRLEVPVEESLLRELKPGRKVKVELEGESEMAISEVLPSLDPQSRTATVRINLPARPGLRSGMSGKIRVPGAEREAVTVPVEAVRVNGQLQTVFVVANGRARASMVTLGARREGRVEVLSGVDAKDRVVVSPPAGLLDGSPVEGAQ
jgi:multidrug efflux pump subunit AcrA (membrane-fusion protein)